MFSSHDENEVEQDSIIYSPLKLNQSSKSSYHRKKKTQELDQRQFNDMQRHEFDYEQ